MSWFLSSWYLSSFPMMLLPAPSSDVGSCPPGWIEDTTRPDKDACYSVRLHKETWGSAQQFCNYDQANIVSFEDDQETDFVTGKRVGSFATYWKRLQPSLRPLLLLFIPLSSVTHYIPLPLLIFFHFISHSDLLKANLERNEFAWIGLNDISDDGNYVWIDGIQSEMPFR